MPQGRPSSVRSVHLKRLLQAAKKSGHTHVSVFVSVHVSVSHKCQMSPIVGEMRVGF